jgi:MFS family permease
MYNAATGWLMTTLDSDPVMVSLVQAATSLPMFLFALPAGALADIIDKRRLILVLEIAITTVSVVFAYFVAVHLMTPAVLLAFMFLAAALSAIEAPAWQAIVPRLVSKEDLGSAVAASSISVNISRAVGPALAGAMVVSFGIASPYWLNAVSNLGIVGVFLWWHPQSERAHGLPAERFTNAIRAGFRYARYNQHLRRTLVRAMGFFLFASAYWALLPLVVSERIGGGPELYVRCSGQSEWVPSAAFSFCRISKLN